MALKVNQAWMDKVEAKKPGFRKTVEWFEALEIPPCPACGSDLTAVCQAGLTSYSIHVAGATSKMQLMMNRSDHEGTYFCQDCRTFFDPDGYTYEQLVTISPTVREQVETARLEDEARAKAERQSESGEA